MADAATARALQTRLGQLGMVGLLDQRAASNVSSPVSSPHRAAPPRSLAETIYPHLAKSAQGKETSDER